MGQKMYYYELCKQYRKSSKNPKFGVTSFMDGPQAVTEVLNKSHYGNSHLQMRQNPIPIAEHSGLNLFQLSLIKLGLLSELVLWIRRVLRIFRKKQTDPL